MMGPGNLEKSPRTKAESFCTHVNISRASRSSCVLTGDTLKNKLRPFWFGPAHRKRETRLLNMRRPQVDARQRSPACIPHFAYLAFTAARTFLAFTRPYQFIISSPHWRLIPISSPSPPLQLLSSACSAGLPARFAPCYNLPASLYLYSYAGLCCANHSTTQFVSAYDSSSMLLIFSTAAVQWVASY